MTDHGEMDSLQPNNTYESEDQSPKFPKNTNLIEPRDNPEKNKENIIQHEGFSQPEELLPEKDAVEVREIQHQEKVHQEEIIPQKNDNPQKENTAHKKKPFKKVLLFLVVAITGYLLYSVADIFVSPDRHIQQIYLVPESAAFIIQTSDPINDYQKFSNSPSWQTLKKAKAFEEISNNIEMIDSVVRDNNTLLSLVGKRDVLVSIHKTRPREFDALIILDLQKISKMDMLKDQIENILSLSGNEVTNRNYKGIKILEMRDADTRDILYLAFVDNHIVLSFTSKLVEAAIDTRDNPQIGLNPSFLDVEKLIGRKGMMQMYVNYTNIPDFMSIFLSGEEKELMETFCNSMEFGGLYFDVHKDRMETKGHTIRKEEADPYITALLHSGQHKMRAHEIMSARTALYSNIGFSDPVTFIKELEVALEGNDPEMFKSYKSNRKRIESFFGISLEENFFGWMSGEFAVSQAEPGLLGQEPEMILAIRAKNIKEAKKNMEYIEKKIKNRTPVKIKTVEYKEYEINYVELKGFFRLFFGGMFDKFEKPYYTYVEDYVILSNKPSSLLSFIEDHNQKNLLKDVSGFKKNHIPFRY